MEERRLGKTGRNVSVIGFGAWAIGGSWGSVDDDVSLAALHAAADAGVTLIDTADVYGDGRSERLIGRFLRERAGEAFFVATKMGRSVPQVAANYTPEAFRDWVDGSRERLGVDRLDLVQLHCPPIEVYYRPDLFEALDALVADGSIAAYGVSVERVEEALKAIEFPGVATVQIIYNIVRQRPADRFLAEAARRNVGVLARVPARLGPAHRQAHPRDHVHPGRPSCVQSPRRILRRRRDVRRPRLRDRARAGRGAAVARSARRHAGPAGPALDPHGRRGDGRHPRREDARPGAGERWCRGPAAAPGGHDGADPRALRGAREAARPPAVVGGWRLSWAPGPCATGLDSR